jgi:hypothetical protein
VNRLVGRVCSVLLACAFCTLVEPRPTRAQEGAKPASERKQSVRVRKKRERAERREARAERPTRGQRTRTRKTAGASTSADRETRAPTGANVTSARAGASAGTRSDVKVGTGAVEAAQAAAAGVDAEIVKEGDTSVKVMKFTGLGIEGRLKSPQLVYFVQRVRAEFERPTLAHRSFMPELAHTTEREPIR